MTSFITTMSVPSACSPSQPAPPQCTFSQSVSCNTINTSRLPLSEPPSYLSPAVRALKEGLHALTPPSNARTRGPFRPRSAAKGTSSYQLRQFAEATLGSGSLRKAVKLPEGEDLNEWLAVNGIYMHRVYRLPTSKCVLTRISDSGRLLQSDQPSVRVHH